MERLPEPPFAIADWVTQRLLRLCARDTTSGHEDQGLGELEELLSDLGANIRLHRVAPGRTNILAVWGVPRVLFSTHLDTVPPYIPPRLDEAKGRIWGRGTCDAKGQIVAQLAAIRWLREEGLDDLAWLGVVGEETDSAGALAAEVWRDALDSCFALVNGEPTELTCAAGQRGIVRLRLACEGKAAHSGLPDRGRSAAWLLLDWLQRIRERPRPEHDDLGPEVWNLGLLRAGEASNVVPAHAEAELLARTIPGSRFVLDVRKQSPPEGSVEILAEDPPFLYPRLEGYPQVAVPFGSDVPILRKLLVGQNVALVGPGSISVAHSEDEHIDVADLVAGAELNRSLAKYFLDRCERGER